jgi:hypothetical protein
MSTIEGVFDNQQIMSRFLVARDFVMLRNATRGGMLFKMLHFKLFEFSVFWAFVNYPTRNIKNKG